MTVHQADRLMCHHFSSGGSPRKIQGDLMIQGDLKIQGEKMRLALYPQDIYSIQYTSQVAQDFWSINSIQLITQFDFLVWGHVTFNRSLLPFNNHPVKRKEVIEFIFWQRRPPPPPPQQQQRRHQHTNSMLAEWLGINEETCIKTGISVSPSRALATSPLACN